MNNYFNFTLPYFNEQFGSDWSSFNTVVESNVDYVYEKTEQLYWLRDPGKMSFQALEKALSVRGIVSSDSSAESNLVMYLPLTNNANDISGNGNNGTATDVTWTGGVANFNGASSYIDTNYKLTSNSWEIVTTFNMDSIAATGALFGSITGKVLIVDINTLGKIDLYLSFDGLNWGVFKGGIDAGIIINTDYVLSLKFTGTEYILYLNNSVIYSVTNSNKVNPLLNISVGKWNATYYLNGTMSNLYIFNHALTDEERTALYTDNTIPAPPNNLVTKRKNLRSFVSSNSSKGMSSVYLDYAESIVGQRGQIYNGYSAGTWTWGTSRWSSPATSETYALIHSTPQTLYDIYIDVKTEDSTLLDEIVSAFRQSFLLPAFYKIHLVNSSLQVLRSV